MENKTKERPQDPKGKNRTWTHASRRKKSKAKLKKSFRINCWNSASLELRSQVLTSSTFCKLAWSWHGQWRWQGCHAQAQFESSMFTNRMYKNEGPSEKKGFKGETVWRFQTKISRTPLLLWRTKEKIHKTPRAKTQHESCSQEEIHWSKIEKKFRIKVFELCKTRTKWSSPDLFIF